MLVIIKPKQFFIALTITATAVASAQERRPITPADCVTVRYLDVVGDGPALLPIAISPDGTRVAYLVRTPNLTTNENAIGLYVRDISGDPDTEAHPLLVGELSRIKWLGDGRHLTVLMNEGGKHVVERVDVDTGAHEIVMKIAEDVVEYDVDTAGDIVVFGVNEPTNGIKQKPSKQEIASGYRIALNFRGPDYLSHTKLFVVRHLNNSWTAPEPISIQSPFTHELIRSLPVMPNSYMSLSPDGKELLVQYQDPIAALPQRWQEDQFVKYMQSVGVLQGTKVLVLYHMDSGVTSVPFETPFVATIPLWSADGRSFVLFAQAPVGSEWARQESGGPLAIAEKGFQLYWVRPSDRKIELVASHDEAPYSEAPPLYWGKDDSLLVGGRDNILRRFVQKDGGWKPEKTVTIPVSGDSTFVSNGSFVVGDMESPITPPTLFSYKLGDSTVKVFAKLNPQFDRLALANTETIDWQTATGLPVRGTLFLPPNGVKGERYPLVIQTKPYGNWFVCDQGPGHFPSFIPQPLASAGIAYLGFYFPDNHDGKALADYYPKGYPGGIAEAALQTQVYDSAVKTLADRGLVDKNNVGIIGFSRSGWYTEFALVHGETRYRAASVTDNVSYSFFEHSIGPIVGDSSKGTSAMYGGPPYGTTLKNWLDYSISFNLEKIHTPLLMEGLGKGELFDRPLSPPFALTQALEVFTGLTELHKPVELYYYPTEKHEPDHPQARLANLQRNLDWFRFWLQGYERPDPKDPNQYVRWRELRKLQNRAEGEFEDSRLQKVDR